MRLSWFKDFSIITILFSILGTFLAAIIGNFTFREPTPPLPSTETAPFISTDAPTSAPILPTLTPDTRPILLFDCGDLFTPGNYDEAFDLYVPKINVTYSGPHQYMYSAVVASLSPDYVWISHELIPGDGTWSGQVVLRPNSSAQIMIIATSEKLNIGGNYVLDNLLEVGGASAAFINCDLPQPGKSVPLAP